MEQKLKIGFDAKRLFYNNTGLGNYSRNLVKNLKLLYPEHEYHLFTPGIVENKSTSFFLDNDFVIHICPQWQPSWYWRSYGVASKINELGLDLYHGLSHEIPFGINKSTKTVVTMHDLIYEKHAELFGWWNASLYKFKYRSACKRADVIFAISENTASDITKLYNISRDKIKITYQSCHENFQTQPLSENKREYFLYVGTINERKSLKDIVIALDSMPTEKRKKLVIVGEGGDYKKDVIKKVQELGLDKWIEFRGNKSNEELIQLYDHAICLILPSKYEGFGIPIIESLFRKTPVITCDNSSLPEAGGPGAIYVSHGDVNALSKAMTEIQSAEKWHDLSENGHRYAVENFNIYTVSKAIGDEYFSLLK